MAELRNRGGAVSAAGESGKPTVTSRGPPGSGIAAESLIGASPQQHGVVLKLHVPLAYHLIPTWLHGVLQSVGCLSCFLPSWKQRYLVSIGSYLYKFKDRQSKSPKGCPFDLASLSVDRVPAKDSPHVGSLPPGFGAVISVSTLRRRHYYAVRDGEEAALWIRSLLEAKQALVTRNMGHDRHMPYPRSWEHFDALAGSLVKSKERIRERLESSNLREMEMSNLMDGGPLPRGYHG